MLAPCSSMRNEASESVPAGVGYGRVVVRGCVAHGHSPVEPCGHHGSRPRSGLRLLHRCHGDDRGGTHLGPGLLQMLGRGGPSLPGGPLRPPRGYRPVLVQGGGRRGSGRARRPGRVVRLPGRTDLEGRGDRAGRVDPVRHPVRPHHGVGAGGGAGGWPAPQAQPSPGAARPAGHRPAPDGPPSGNRRGSGRGHQVLHRHPRVQDHRATPRR